MTDYRREAELREEGRMRRGRPRLRWEDCVKRDVRKAGEEEDWKKKTRDRGGWKRLSDEAVKKLQAAPPALDISTGPLARRTFQTAGPVRASTFYLSLARTGHLDICRATRFQIVVARTMTNHSMYFSRGRPSHISAVFALSFCYSETPA